MQRQKVKVKKTENKMGSKREEVSSPHSKSSLQTTHRPKVRAMNLPDTYTTNSRDHQLVIIIALIDLCPTRDMLIELLGFVNISRRKRMPESLHVVTTIDPVGSIELSFFKGKSDSDKWICHVVDISFARQCGKSAEQIRSNKSSSHGRFANSESRSQSLVARWETSTTHTFSKVKVYLSE
jgi:hypothetical protein